jgi:hypothetical protein
LIISAPPASSASLNSIINQTDDCGDRDGDGDGDGDGDELMAQASEVLNEDAITQAMVCSAVVAVANRADNLV